MKIFKLNDCSGIFTKKMLFYVQVWGSFWKDGEWGYQCCHSTIKNSYCTGETGKDVAQDNKTDVPTPAAIMPPPETTKKVTWPVDSDDDDSDDSDGDRVVRRKVPTPPPEKTPEELEEEREERKKSEARRQKKRDRKKRKKEKADKKKKKSKKGSKRHESSDSSSESDSEDEEVLRKKKLEKALKAEEERIRQVNKMLQMDERKRPYNSMNIDSTAPNEEELEAYHMKRKRDEDPMSAFL